MNKSIETQYLDYEDFILAQRNIPMIERQKSLWYWCKGMLESKTLSPEDKSFLTQQKNRLKWSILK